MKIFPLFLWLALPLGAWSAYSAWGTTHVLVSYTYRGDGGREPHAPRHHTSCTYWGWSGRPTLSAEAGRCPWIRFLHGGRDQ